MYDLDVIISKNKWNSSFRLLVAISMIIIIKKKLKEKSNSNRYILINPNHVATQKPAIKRL